MRYQNHVKKALEEVQQMGMVTGYSNLVNNKVSLNDAINKQLGTLVEQDEVFQELEAKNETTPFIAEAKEVIEKEKIRLTTVANQTQHEIIQPMI